jgi:tetratricopeptide (TPR) repeat protein
MIIDFAGLIEELKTLRDSGGPPLDPVRLMHEKLNTEFIPANELCSYSWALTQAGEWAWAEQIANSIQDNEDEKGQALAILAQRLAGRGIFDEAFRIVYLILNSPSQGSGALIEKVVAFTYIALGSLKNGDFKQVNKALVDAEKTLETLDYKSTTIAHLWCDVAEIWKQIGKRDEALRLWKIAVMTAYEVYAYDIINQYPTADSRKALSGIIRSIAEIGEIEEAKEMIEKYVREGIKVSLLWIISEVEKKIRQTTENQ